MIYTCYEMVRDCRANLPEGWMHFIVHYVPVIRQALAHYAPQRAQEAALLDQILLSVRQPESFLFQSSEPPEERWFVAQLRQLMVAELATSPAAIPLDLETLTAALAPLTMTEKQATWFETMRYPPAQAGPMLRVSPETVEKVRHRAAELIRGKVDAWRRTLLAENGPALGREAAAGGGGADCLPTKAFLDVVDGRTTWSGREMVDRHLGSCWHCVDHFCRILEVVHLLRGSQPLSEAESQPYRELLGLAARLAAGLPAGNFRVEAIEEMSFPDGFADVVLSSAVLHFASGDDQFLAMLRGAWRVLKPGGLLFCRLASTIGMEQQMQCIGGRRFRLPDGSDRYLVDASLLGELTEELGGRLMDPLKTTVVQGQRAMTTWVLQKDA